MCTKWGCFNFHPVTMFDRYTFILLSKLWQIIRHKGNCWSKTKNFYHNSPHGLLANLPTNDFWEFTKKNKNHFASEKITVVLWYTPKCATPGVSASASASCPKISPRYAKDLRRKSPRCPQDVLKRCPLDTSKYLEVPQSTLNYPEVPQCTSKYQKVPGSTKKYHKIPRAECDIHANFNTNKQTNICIKIFAQTNFRIYSHTKFDTKESLIKYS